MTGEWYMRGQQPRDRVLGALRAEPERWATTREIADALDISTSRAGSALGALFVRGAVVRRDAGGRGPGTTRWVWRAL